MDDFLSKIETVNQQVKDIVDGKMTLDEVDQHEIAEIRKKHTLEEIEKRELKERFLKGRPGKGHQGGYKLICTRCMVEFLIDDIKKCTHCGKSD